MSGAAFRVGDAERDAAVAALGEHFAAGRLTKDEFDERSGRAWSARYGDDLDDLFTDLPQPVAVRAEASPSPRARRPRPVGRMLLTIPLAMMAFGGLLFLIVWVAPWLLFVFGLLFLFGGPPGRRRHWWHDGGGQRSGWRPPGWAPSSRDDRSGERRDWPPARPGWGPQPRGGWASSR